MVEMWGVSMDVSDGARRELVAVDERSGESAYGGYGNAYGAPVAEAPVARSIGGAEGAVAWIGWGREGHREFRHSRPSTQSAVCNRLRFKGGKQEVTGTSAPLGGAHRNL